MRINRGNGGIAFVLFVVAAMFVSTNAAWGVDDTTPPTVKVVTPAANGVYGQNAAVKANYSCSDASGISACVGTVGNGAHIPTQALGTHNFFVSGYDNAGNKTKVERTYTVVDKTAPQIILNTPADGAKYAKNAAVAARFSCYDAGVGVQSCIGTVANGSNLPTGSTGKKKFTVTAKDVAGNTAVKTVWYQVV